MYNMGNVIFFVRGFEPSRTASFSHLFRRECTAYTHFIFTNNVYFIYSIMSTSPKSTPTIVSNEQKQVSSY